MVIETTKDLKSLRRMREATIKHLERLMDIGGFDDIKQDLERIEKRISELEKPKDSCPFSCCSSGEKCDEE